MGLLDVLNGMQHGPRGQSQPGAGGGMSPITMALLGLLAYKAVKSFSQPAAGQQLHDRYGDPAGGIKRLPGLAEGERAGQCPQPGQRVVLGAGSEVDAVGDLEQLAGSDRSGKLFGPQSQLGEPLRLRCGEGSSREPLADLGDRGAHRVRQPRGRPGDVHPPVGDGQLPAE